MISPAASAVPTAARTPGKEEPPLLGLVRAVDLERWRHRIGIGEKPKGTFGGELGSLLAHPAPGAIPVWLSADGRLVAEGGKQNVPRLHPRTAVKWARAPLNWRGLGRRRTRAKAVARRAWRLREVRWVRRSPTADRRQAPVGWLWTSPGPQRRPLYAALHQTTADQLLTTDPKEALALTYRKPVKLGYLVSAAPVTGVLGLLRTPLPWARAMKRSRARSFEQLSLGAIDEPSTDAPVEREDFSVKGWALCNPGSVSRIEIFVDGRRVGKARLGLPRPDLRKGKLTRPHPAASIAGFRWSAAPSDLPDDRDHVHIEALVRAADGESFKLTLPRDVSLEPLERPLEDGDDDATRLRDGGGRTSSSRRSSSNGAPRLLAFTHRLDHGGAQRYFFEQVQRLSEMGLACTVVAPLDGFWRHRLEDIGVDVLLTPSYPCHGALEYEGAVTQLSAWIEQTGFDAVFVNTLDAWIGSDTAQRLGLPTVWSIHESFELPAWWTASQGGQGHPYVFERLEKALGLASQLVFAADATKRLFEPYASAERMVTMPYGIELTDIDAFRERFDEGASRRGAAVPEEALVVLCLGTVNPRKAQSVLAQAFAEVAPAHPRAHLFLVGDGGGRYSEGIRQFWAQTGLDERCTLVPVTSDAYSWHGMADLFVLSSDIESSPISILEAMAFETPVLASSVFGVPELIEDGRHGYLCEPNDVGNLAASLDRVLAIDAAEREGVGRAGAERVRERHDPRRYAERLYGILAEVTSHSSRA